MLALIALAMLAGCANENKRPEPGQIVEIPISSFPEAPDDETIFQNYRIASGDVLDILFQASTWRRRDRFDLSVGNMVSVRFVHHGDLNTSQRILPDGTISLPYLGVTPVIGKTVAELTEELTEAYKAKLESPQVYVVVEEFANAIKELRQDLHTAPRGLSRLTTVRPDGVATFPMIGGVKVAGHTVSEVNAELDKRYDEIIPGMSVDLFLHEHAGRNIYVLGSVMDPGSHSISRPTTVVEAIAMSGSFVPSANPKEVAVLRIKGDKMVGQIVNVQKSLNLQAESEFFFLQPDDIVYVPRRKLDRWATVARDVADVLFFRGWNVGMSFSYELHEEGDD